MGNDYHTMSTQVHELFHCLYNQNWEKVGGYFEKIKKYGNLSDLCTG